MHTSRTVGGKSGAEIAFEGVHRFYKPKAPDGEQLVGVLVGGIILFDYVGYQAEVVLDELISGAGVAV